MRLLWVMLCIGCSSASFDIASAPPADSSVADSATTDTGNVSSDTSVAPDGPADADGGCVDPKPPPPPCIVANSDFAPQIDVPGGSNVETLKSGTQIGFHLRMPRDGRIGKIVVRMIPQSIGGGSAGSVTLQGFVPGCIPRPVGKVTVPVTAVDTWTFDFSGVATALPTLAKNAEITFVLTTDSEAWQFVLSGSTTPSPNPYELYFAKRPGAMGDFMPVLGYMMSVKVYTYAC